MLDWDQKLVEASLQLLKEIWSGQNEFLHGRTKQEASDTLRQLTIERVAQIYKFPPKLHKHFPKIHRVTLQERLSRNTTSLQ